MVKNVFIFIGYWGSEIMVVVVGWKCKLMYAAICKVFRLM
jgi:hypothetical protein